MSNLKGRLAAAEFAAMVQKAARRQSAMDELSKWRDENATPEEQDAWLRVVMNFPIDEQGLLKMHHTREEFEILRAQFPVRDGDYELFEKLWERLPPDLVERLKE